MEKFKYNAMMPNSALDNLVFLGVKKTKNKSNNKRKQKSKRKTKRVSSMRNQLTIHNIYSLIL